jgi:alkaline phosphatase
VLISDGGGYNQFDAARLYESGTSHQQVEVAPNSGAVAKVPGTKGEVYDDFPVQVAQ